MESKAKIQERFARALKTAIKEKKLTLRRLAIESDLEYAHVQRIASGKVNLELTTIVALCEGLNITPDQLFQHF